MPKAQTYRPIQWTIAIAGIGCALVTGGCDALFESDDAESQFLVRRVDQLEQRVQQLEGQLVRQGGGGAAVRSSAAAPAVPGLPPSPGLPVSATAAQGSAAAISGSAAASRQTDEDRANILLLKAKQLESVPRSQLIAKFTELAIGAPEIDEIQGEIRLLEAERARVAGDGTGDAAKLKELDANLDKIRYRLEIAAEGVRGRVLDASRDASARLQPAPVKPGGGAPGKAKTQ